MKKRYVTAIIILGILVFLCIVSVIVQENTARQASSTDVGTVSDITVPELGLYCGEYQIAELTGYAMKMDSFYMRDNLAVIEDGSVHALINTNGVTIKDISYQVREIDGEGLLDDNTINDFEENENVIDFYIDITDVVKQGEEYILEIALKTEGQDEIYYYSRITEPNENLIEDQAEFALEFNRLTFMHEDATDLYYYLESDSSFDNTNLGYVTLNANFDQLTWGSLDPEQVEDPKIDLKEINVLDAGSAATFELTYKIKTGEEGEEVYYNVTEDITVWTYYSSMHVLAYERTVEEIFEASDSTVTYNRIYMGIHEDTDLDYVQDEESTYLVFASGSSLWSVDTSSKSVNRVFNTDSEDFSDYKIEPISVDEDGNIQFAVIGYVTYGEHIGKSGIGIYSYDHESDEVEENVFIPYSRPYQTLKEEIGDLYYINDGVLYMMLYDSLQYVNMTTKEYGTLIDGLSSGNYAVSLSQNAIAYNTDKTIYDSGSITILNLDTLNEHIIEAGENKKIRVLGYSGDNLVYGIAKESKITADEDGNTVFAMSKINIMGSDYEIIKSYSKKKVYVTDVEISDAMINLKRISGGEEISDDQLIDNTEKITSIIEVSYLIDDTKKRVMTLVFETSMSSSTELAVTNTDKCETKGSNELNIELEQNDADIYYIYGLGKLRMITDNLTEAKTIARDEKGTVIDKSGQKVWVFEEHYNDD